MNKDWHKKSLRHFFLHLSQEQISTSSTISPSIMSMPIVLVPIIGTACIATV